MRERGQPPYSVLGTALFVATALAVALLLAWHRLVAAVLVLAVVFVLTLLLRKLGLLDRWTYGRASESAPRAARAMTPEEVTRRRRVTIVVLVAVLLPLPFLIFGGR